MARRRAHPLPRRPHGGRDPPGRDEPLAAGSSDRRRGAAAARVQRGPAPGRRARFARRRVRPAQPDVRAPPVARARVLRLAADRPADVALDGRPPGGPLLPRLRPRLHPSVGADDRDRRRRDARGEPGAGRGGAGAGAVRGRDRRALRPPQPAGQPGGPAADRGAHRRGRGERLGRAGGQGVRAGGAAGRALPQGGRSACSTSRWSRRGCARSTTRSSGSSRSSGSPRCCWSAAARRSTGRSPSASSSPSTATS